MSLKKTYRILTAGYFGEAFQQFITTQYPELSCFYASNKTEALDLLPTVDAIAGFNFLPETNLNHIKWIHSFGAGVDAFMQHKIADDVLFTKTAGNMGSRMAEYCLGHILNELQSIKYFEKLQIESKWKQADTAELSSKTLYLLGTGNMGQAIAKKFNPLVKEVIGINTRGDLSAAFSRVITIEKFNKIEDNGAILISTLPATEHTFQIINAEMFENKHALTFLNIGRGSSLNNTDLLEAIQKKSVKKAILDVFSEEPLPKESPFWENTAITITPHISGLTKFQDVTDSFEMVYMAIKNSEPIPYQVNLAKGY